MQAIEKGGSAGGAVKALSSVGRTISRSRAVSRTARAIPRKNTVRRAASSNSHQSTSTHYSSGGSGSSRHSGNSGGSGRSRPSVAVPVVAPRPAPKPPSINSYLGTDSVYQQALSGGKRTLADYLSELNRRRGEAGTQYNQTKGNMERDRVQQLDDLRNEYASRGLIQSGLYGEKQGEFQQQFTDQSNALNQQQTGLLADLLSQQNNYKRENDLAMQAAKQEALQRRAAKYKIGA